jgi:multiple sugar transport system ATP-binding protein
LPGVGDYSDFGRRQERTSQEVCAAQAGKMANVSLKNIKKIYDKNVTAVRDFSLEVEDKEFVVLVGPSGCGKSTLLRMVAGLEEITSGELRIGGKIVNDIPPRDRDIAMVFQNYALYPHMSVRENMAFALKLRRMKKNEIEAKVNEAADILGITEYLDRKPKALSGGQRQRVAIGRAIVREPQVFLMDEPLSNLDAKLRNQMRAEIIKLRQRVDTTFIYVTHDQTEAMTLGDRVVIMKDGIIQQTGAPQQVFDKPRNLFVANFIGAPQMNMFSGKLEKRDGKFIVDTGEAVVVPPEDIQNALNRKNAAETDVILGIRPEHIRVVPAGTQNTITRRLEVSEMMGSEIYMHFPHDNLAGKNSRAIGGENEEKDIIVRVATTGLPPGIRLDLHEHPEISFELPPELTHIFDASSGVSLL